MEIVFSDDDLARVRVWTKLDVMTEMVYASHRWRAPHRLAVLGGWARRTMTDLGPLAAPVLRDVRSGAFQSIGLGLGIFPDRGFDDLVDTSLSRPTRQWQELISVHRGHVRFPIQPGLAEGRPEALTSISESLRHFHRIALTPYWDQLSTMAALFATAWMNTLSARGLEALFSELHPTVTWHQPTLSIASSLPKFCDPSCFHHATHHEKASRGERFRISRRGLTIMPTVFHPGCGTWGDFDPERGWAVYYLTVPVPVTWQWFETSTAGDAGDALGDLLGLTRSWVLQACLDSSPTTTKLAQTVGISMSSASEHAAVLRAAGLLRSERRGNRMVHRATPMGAVLIRSTRTPVPEQARLAMETQSTVSRSVQDATMPDHRPQHDAATCATVTD